MLLEIILVVFGWLIDQGKVCVIGVFNYSVLWLCDVLVVLVDYVLLCYEMLQFEYNLYDWGGYEVELELLVCEQQIGVISYYLLVSGFFSGKYWCVDDVVKSSVCGCSVVDRYFNLCGLCIFIVLDDIVGMYGVSLLQVVFVWLIVWLGIIVLIVSVISVE